MLPIHQMPIVSSPYPRYSKDYKQNKILMLTEKREVRLQDFQIEYKLGEGAYGYVFLASKSSRQYAVKEMSKHKLKKHHCQHLPLVQKQILKLVQHPGIVKSYHAFQNHSKLYLALEVCEGGKFQDFLVQNYLTEASRRFYFAQLVNILEYLHKNGIVHRDLKPTNLMLTKQNHLKMIDFGTACLQNSTLVPGNFKQKLAEFKGKKQSEYDPKTEQYTVACGRIKKRKSSFVGTSYYVSPELLEFNECNAPADLWALGCILYYLYYGVGPFAEKSQLEVFHRIKEAQFHFPPNQQLTEQAKDLITRLLVKRPSDRLGSCSSQQLSFAALKKHPYICHLDVDNIFQTQPPVNTNSVIQLESQVSLLDSKQDLQNKPKDSQCILQKLVIKHTEDGELIYKIVLKQTNVLEQYEVGGLSDQPVLYKLMADADGKVAHLLSEKRFSVGVHNYQRLIFTCKQAQEICKLINTTFSAESISTQSQ